MNEPRNDTEAMLRKFHAEHAGATSAICAAPKTGPSSYARLVDLVPSGGAQLTVVDLACGDGTLLDLVGQRGPKVKLVGVDMSPDELRLARQRLGDRAELRLERAQALSLPDASADCVLCHLALMLMEPVEPAIGEIARVLKPRGVFGAVVNGSPVRGDAWEAFGTAAHEIMRREGAHASVGDRRVLSVEGLRQLFNTRTGFEEPVTTDDFVLAMDGTLEEVKQRLLLTYVVTMLSPDGLRELESRMDALLTPLQRPDGTVPCSLGLRLIRCERRAD